MITELHDHSQENSLEHNFLHHAVPFGDELINSVESSSYLRCRENNLSLTCASNILPSISYPEWRMQLRAAGVWEPHAGKV